MINNNTSCIKVSDTQILYNHLNLPTSITLGTGTISYLYNAVGEKSRENSKKE